MLKPRLFEIQRVAAPALCGSETILPYRLPYRKQPIVEFVEKIFNQLYNQGISEQSSGGGQRVFCPNFSV